MMLLYPVRMVFREDGIFSFASKTVVAPQLDQKAFSWSDAGLANVCAASDGNCSVYRIRHTESRVEAVLRAQFYSLAKASYRVFHPNTGIRERIRIPARRLFGPLLERLAPFEIQQVPCHITVFGLPPAGTFRHS